MKNIALFFTAISALFAISCNKEAVSNETNLPPVEGMKIVTFSATVAKEATKTSYSGEGTFSWTAGDEISVACSNGSYYTFTATKSGSKTSFTGYIPEGTDIGTRAYFPADPDHADTKFCVTKEKDLRSHPSADLPMVGTGSKVGDDYKFSFSHCSGAALLTIDNIPSGIKYVEISVENASLNLSGQFTLSKVGDTDDYNWEPKAKGSDHEFYIRKVNVSDNKAQMYLPYASEPGTNMWGATTINVTGYDKDDVPTALITGKSMKALGTFNRAEVKPLTPLGVNQLGYIDWTDGSIASFAGNGEGHNYGERIIQWKASSDEYYLYFYYKILKEKIKWDAEGGSYAGSSSKIYIGLDLDNDSSSGSSDSFAGIPAAGWEATIEVRPWSGTTQGSPEVIPGENANSCGFRR